MSKSVDLTKPLSGFDAEYVQARPWLIEDAKLAGIEVTFADDEEAVDYTKFSVDELKTEIARRNGELEEDEPEISSKGNKSDLINALQADDEAIAAAAAEDAEEE